MPRTLRVAAAQVGRIDRATPRLAVLSRLISLLDTAARRNVQLVVFPETTLTTFFPRYLLDGAELASYFERDDEDSLKNDGEENILGRLFDHAKSVGVDMVIGYAESTDEIEALRRGYKGEEQGEPHATPQGYNTSVYVDGKTGRIRAKYRKVHLPGTVDPFDDDPQTTNQLEKRYFRPGDLGFEAFRAPNLRSEGDGKSPIVGMLICNDRRWAEGWRCYGLQGVEIVCIGFNTTAWAPELLGHSRHLSREQSRAEAMFHHKLVVQANAYSNATFSIVSARCGWDDGKYELISGSMIVDPEGHIVAENKTLDDELIMAEIDLDACKSGKSKVFCFEKHRRPESYGRIVDQVGVIEPPELA